MKRILILPVLVAAIAAAALGNTSEAKAHNTPWHWTAQNVVDTLVDDGINWTDGQDWMESIYCKGRGPSIRRGNSLLFRHFTCHIRSLDGEAYVINFHVQSRFDYLVRFVRMGGLYS